jgi:hypothetical protein
MFFRLGPMIGLIDLLFQVMRLGSAILFSVFVFADLLPIKALTLCGRQFSGEFHQVPFA